MHTIDELAHISGMPSRTIRFYNTEGMLPPPTMRGRVAYYDEEHLLVLRIIKELKEQQNLPLDTIKHMLEIRAEYGEMQMNLALKQRLQRSLTGGQEVHLTKAALMQQTGASEKWIDELTDQDLLFPGKTENGLLYSSDDILLLQLYQRLERSGTSNSTAVISAFSTAPACTKRNCCFRAICAAALAGRGPFI